MAHTEKPVVGAGVGDDDKRLTAMPTSPLPSAKSSVEPVVKYDDTLSSNKTKWKRVYDVLSYAPPRCRYDPDKPFEFNMGLNVLFALAGCVTVANLYYTHPILNLFARDFGVTDQEASYIPTLAQAGYAAGLLFICPMADLVKRRPFVLWLMWLTATLWIGLCITESYAAFAAISFITGVTTVTPQIMLPLVGDKAPPHKRPTCIAIIVSGMLFGMMLARFLSGVVAQFIGWRYIYWISFALQYIILMLLYIYMPDYPSTNPDHTIWKKYPSLLWDILRLALKHPVIVQACLVGFFTASTFTNYWTTLTFLLAGPPYHYQSLVIGLFALIGFASMTWGPIYARTVMEKHEPWMSVFLGEIICFTGVVVGTYTGKMSVAGPILQAMLIDIGNQQSQIANRTSIYAVEPKARNRVNTAYMVSVFCGQLMGTAVGNAAYAKAGWFASGSVSVGCIVAAMIVCLARGPHEQGWFGWGGGYRMSKPRPGQQAEARADEESHVQTMPELTANEVDASPIGQEVKEHPVQKQSVGGTVHSSELHLNGEKFQKNDLS